MSGSTLRIDHTHSDTIKRKMVNNRYVHRRNTQCTLDALNKHVLNIQLLRFKSDSFINISINVSTFLQNLLQLTLHLINDSFKLICLKCIKVKQNYAYQNNIFALILIFVYGQF